MSRPIAVLRPQPGNAATAGRIEAAGAIAIRLPLFAVRPLAWDAPDPARFDALLLTSANAVRHGGDAVATLRTLPVVAVGAATARAAREAGLNVAATGDADAAALIAAAAESGHARLLHLCGRDHGVARGGAVRAVIPVYTSEALAIPAELLVRLSGSVALLHSERAARRIAALLDAAGVARTGVAVAAISPKVATAAGAGWHRVAIAERPSDTALIDAARAIAD